MALKWSKVDDSSWLCKGRDFEGAAILRDGWWRTTFRAGHVFGGGGRFSTVGAAKRSLADLAKRNARR